MTARLELAAVSTGVAITAILALGVVFFVSSNGGGGNRRLV